MDLRGSPPPAVVVARGAGGRGGTLSALLEVSGLHKRYGSEHVLRGIDLSVRAGEVKAILGPSGSGKSTLLRCLALLEPVDQGEVRLEGRTLGTRGARAAGERELARQRQDIGMVFQRFNLFPHMTALENVMSGLVIVRGLSKAEAREQASRLLERVGLTPRANAFPSELSGGQQQRVAIARALVMRPKIMLFDEPTSALDAELVREVLDVMEDLATSGMTMLVVTHELAFARRAADRVCMMDEGLVIEEAEPERFFDSPEQSRTRSFLDAVD
jgi:ABC-type polar amino acid transport system ATPase subunit